MKRILLALLAALALPTAVNAETMKITETEYLDGLIFGGFTGSILAICRTNEEGFLSNNEKLEMIKIFTGYHKDLYKNKTKYNKDKKQIFSRMRSLFPNCLP